MHNYQSKNTIIVYYLLKHQYEIYKMYMSPMYIYTFPPTKCLLWFYLVGWCVCFNTV